MNKELLNQVTENKVKVDTTNIREVASVYKDLKEIADLVKAKMDKLVVILKDKEVNEVFEDELMKVTFQEGKTKSELDNNVICSELSLLEIIEFAKFTEKGLKDGGKEWLVVKAKKTLEEKSAQSVKVAKLTKPEVKLLEDAKLLKGSK